MTFADLIPLWITIIMVVCDLAMIISGICLYKKNITIQSNWIGKLGTLIISLGVILSFFTEWIGNANIYVIYAGIITAIIAGLNYVYIFFTKKINIHKNNKEVMEEKKEINENTKN